jgi:hypothetical protein
MDKSEYIIKLSNLEKDINRIKMNFNGSNCIYHNINIGEDNSVVITLYEIENLMSNTYILYGRLIDSNIYITHNEYLNGYPRELLKVSDEELIEMLKNETED